MGYRMLSRMFLIWLFSSAATGRRTKNSFLCTSSCSQVQPEKSLYGATCFCSKSCLIYNDCCEDAPYQNTGSVNVNQTCITLNNLGPVSLVSSCPSSSGVWSEACYSGVKTFFPVTSKDTGTSYFNYFCALCNRDTNVVIWPVRLRCNDEKRKTENKSEVNRLESMLKRSHDSTLFGDCKLYAENDDVTFTKNLELRQCYISQCMSSWENETTRKLCGSLLDPVYTPNGIYRNTHCAQCNGETKWTPKCFPLPLYKSKQDCKGPTDLASAMKGPCIKTDCPPGKKLHPRSMKCVSYQT